ncbi:hypothetical protein FB451DRAFT_1549286 [Mycena latifolia]|nr:hypothetical protein FB451DRAFT_1549286 [Mycena latifolia]
MVVGPAIIHAAAIWLYTVLLALRGIPCTSRAVIRELSARGSLFFFLRGSLSSATFLISYFGIQLIWRFFSCAQSRAKVWEVCWFSVAQYQQRKSIEIEDFGVLVFTLRRAFFTGVNLCMERWGMLCWGHRLLIVAPAVIFYSYFYLLPAAQRVRIWLRRRRRRRR